MSEPHDDSRDEPHPKSFARERWRREFGLREDSGLEGAVRTTTAAPPPRDRVAQAREAMVRLVKDRFGGDGALMKQVQSLTLSASDAVALLQETRATAVPTDQQFEALEAVVVFDGTRPSFLLKNDEIDFDSSFNTGTWQNDLKPFLSAVTERAACVGRVEKDGAHEGTAFLVTPTIAITNRHVAQLIASFHDGKITLNGQCTLDFGREDGAGRTSHDKRTIAEILFAGPDEISAPIKHQRLDLAVVRVSPSKLAGAAATRRLAIGATQFSELADSRFVATVGYPANPVGLVPDETWLQYGKLIRKLLEGDGGAKRFAPGQPMSVSRAELPEWTATHDATTINGNSGSPLLVFPADGAARAAGLHYGGRSGGERVNWAHLLYYTGKTSGYGSEGSFAEFCAREGIDLK